MNFPEEDEWWKLGNIDTITCPSPDPNLAIPFREPSPMQFMQIQSPSRDLTSIPFQDDMMQVYDDRMTPGGSTYQMMQTMQNTSYSEMHTLHAETSGISSYEQPSSIVNGDYMDNGLGLDVGPPHYFQQQQDPNTMQNHQQQQQQQPQQQQQQHHSVMQQMLTSESPMNQNHMSSQNVQSPMSGQQMHMQQQQPQQPQQQQQQQTPQQGAQQQTPQGKQPASTAAASRSKNRNIQPRQPNGASRKKGTGANQNSNNTVGAVLAKANKLAAASSTDPSQNQALPNPGGIEMRMSMEHSSQVAQLSMEIAQLTEDQQKRGVDHSVRLRDLEGKRAQIFFEALRKQHIDVEALQRPAASTPAARPPKRQTNSPYQPQYLTQQQGQQQQQLQQQQPVSIQPAPQQQQQQQTQYYTTTTTATTTPQARRQTQQQQQQQQILSAPGMPQIQLQTTTHSRRAPPLYKQVQLTYVTQPSSSSGGTYQITTSQPQIVLQTQQSGGGQQQQSQQQQQQPQQQQTVQLQLQQVQQVQVSSSAQNQQLQHLQQQHQQQQQLQHPTQPYREPSVREVVQVVVGSSANGNGVQGPIMVRQQQGAPIPATLQHVSTASISSIPSTSTGLSMNSPVASVLRSQLQQQHQQQGGPAGQQLRNGGVAVNSRQRQPVATLHMLQQQQQDANRMQQQQHQLSQQQQQPQQQQQTFMQQHIKQEVVVQRPPPVQVPKLNPAQCAKRIEEKKLQRAQRLRDGLQCLADRLCEPDTDTPFDSVSDAMQRLLPFGLYHEPHLSDDTLQHADTQLLRAFIGLDERQKQLEKRLRRVVLSDKLSNPEHQELNLLLQLEGEYEKRKLEEEKEMVTDETRADFITNSTLIAGLREAGISDPKGQSRLGAAPVKTIGLGTYEYHPFCDIPPSTPRPPPSPSPPPRTRRSPSKSPLKSPLSSPASSRYGSRSRRQSSSSFMSPSESITSPAPSAAPSVVRYARRTERGAARKEPRQPEVEAEKEEKKPVIPVVEEISPAPVLKREPSLSPLKSPIRSPPTPARRLPPKMLAKAADRKAREQQGEGEEGVPAPVMAHQARKSPQKKETKPPPQRLSSLGRSPRGSASVAANTATTIIAAIPPALAPPPLRAALPPPAPVLSNHVTTTIAQSIANYNRRTSLVESNLEDEASDGSASPEFDVPEPVTPVTIKSVPVPPSRSFESTVVKEDAGSRFTSPPKSARLPPPRRGIMQKEETPTTRGMPEKVVKEEKETREKNHLNESTEVIPSISERITESRLPLRLRKSRVHEVKEEDENRIPSRDFSSSPVPSVASNESMVERKPLKLKISLGARPPSQASSLVEERVVKVEDADDEGSRREKEKKHKKHKKKKKKRKHGDEDAPVEEMECEQKPEPFLDTEEPCCSKSLPPPVDAPPAPPRLVLKFSLGKNSVKTSASPMTSSSSPHREPSELASGPAPDSRPTSACLKVPPLKISRGRSESPAIGKADSPLPPVVPKLRIPSAKLRRSNTPKRVPEASAPVVPHPPPPSALVDDGTPAPPPAKIPRLKIRFGTASASTTVVAEPAAVVVATPKPAPPVVAPPSPPRVVVKKQEPSQSPEENALRIQFSDGEDSDNDDGMRASDEALARCGLAMRSSPPKEHSSASMWTLQ